MAEAYYVQRPIGPAWKTNYENCVIKAKTKTLFIVNESSSESKVDKAFSTFLEIVEPSDYPCRVLPKSDWVECSESSRRLSFGQYVDLYHSIEPDLPLPRGWTELQPTWPRLKKSNLKSKLNLNSKL